MDSWGDRMPLPDAIKRSPRVYTNLQNIDLDTVTFANIQATGNPIAVEEMNEDEMRRLVLVNLARLVCAGEWNGLLTAASAGEYNVELVSSDISGSYLRHTVTNYPPWGSNTSSNSTIESINTPECFPFVSPETGDLAEMGVYVSAGATNTLRVGIYNTDGDSGVPTTLIGYGDFTTDGSGAVGALYQTSFSDTISLTRGEQYWIIYVRTESGTSPGVRAAGNSAGYFIGPSANAANAPNQQTTLVLASSDNALPSTVTATDLTPTYGSKLRLTLKW